MMMYIVKYIWSDAWYDLMHILSAMCSMSHLSDPYCFLILIRLKIPSCITTKLDTCRVNCNKDKVDKVMNSKTQQGS